MARFSSATNLLFCHLVLHHVQHFVAMGYFALIVMRRWRKWAHREAGLRYLFEKLCVRAAVRRWKEAVKLTAFQVLLRRLSVRKALERWKKSVEKRAAVEAARDHHSRNLVSKVRRSRFTTHYVAGNT